MITRSEPVEWGISPHVESLAMIRTPRLFRKKPKEGLAPVLMFDFDGVVADSLEVFYAEFSAALISLGFEKLSNKESLLSLFDGNVFKSLIKLGFPMRKLKALSGEFGPRIEKANQQVQPFEGMPELVSELAAAFPLYVITSNQTRAIEDFLERYQITGVREVLGADKEASKVKKIRRVVKGHPNCSPWYMGDTKGDMLEGNEAGALTVAIAWGWHDEERLRTGKPHRVVRTPAELRALFLA